MPPSREQREAELTVVQAASSILAGESSLPRWRPPDTHRLDGISGLRAWRMLLAHTAWRSKEPGFGVGLIETVRQSLNADLAIAGQPDGPSAREAAHLRKLLAFAIGLWAFRSAQARLAGFPADRETIISEARKAADMMRTEPYLRYLQAETLLLLGETEELTAELKPLAQAPWLGEWKMAFDDALRWHDDASRRRRVDQYLLPAGDMLPPGAADVRLRAMSSLPGWLDRAGAELPYLLRAEAADTPPLETLYRVELSISKDDFPDDAAVDRLIGSVDSQEEPTLLGLLAALNRQFGIVLYTKRPQQDGSLSAGQATVAFDTRIVATAGASDLAQTHDVAHWWPGIATAPVALQVLLVAALRILHRCQLSDKGLSPSEREAQLLMLADRMAYGRTEEDVRKLLADESDPVLAIAALRLSFEHFGDAQPMWGMETWRDLVLLDHETEQACVAGMIPGPGLAIAPDVLARIARGLRRRIGDDKQQEKRATPAQPALVVRDPVLRPLMRALLRDMFPDLPVLAVAEVEAQGRTLALLDASERAVA